ncbi:MAG: DUF4839 domain-containing protein [Sporichthyaceae bacterium]
MHRFRLAIAGVIVFGLAGCGGSEAPAVMPDLTGDRLDVALDDIKTAGFEDDVKVLGGGVFGIVDKSNWTVCEQTPAAGQPVAAPRLTVERSCSNAAPSEAPSQAVVVPTQTPAATPEQTVTETLEPGGTLTTKNNRELAALMKVGDYCADEAVDFAAKYAGRTIAFDGSIVNMALHGSYKTRYDILIGPGDQGPNTTKGPAFKFQDVNLVSDIRLADRNRPANIGEGDRFRFVAEVGEYNADTCLFFLKPVSTQAR